MEKKNAFTITRARPEDAAALLDYLKIVGGETDNLSFGAEGVPLAPEEEQAYLRTQVDSPDHVQYLARVDGELIGTASLNRKPGRMRHRGVFGISLKRAWWGCGAASALTEAVLAFARENGFAQLDIEVRSDNVRAIRLYEKFGFRKLCTFPGGDPVETGSGSSATVLDFIYDNHGLPFALNYSTQAPAPRQKSTLCATVGTTTTPRQGSITSKADITTR